MTTQTRQRPNFPQPPQSSETEKAVLGAALRDGGAADLVCGVIRDSSQFYSRRHQLIYDAILSLHRANQPCDLTTVMNELSRTGALENVGGRVYLAELFNGVVSTCDVATHAAIVIEKANLRRLLAVANDIEAECYRGERGFMEIHDAAERSIYEMSEASKVAKVSHIGDIAPEVLEHFYAWNSGEIGKKLILTGFKSLDRLVTGMLPGDLIFIAGRPTQGKTQLALQIAMEAAKNHHVLIVSLEMTKLALASRAVLSLAHLDSMRVRRGELTASDWDSATRALNNVANLNLSFTDDMSLTVSGLRSLCRSMKSQRGLGLLVVDYLQMMETEGRHETRAQAVGSLSRGLKRIAKEIDIPVLAVSQLNRAAVDREPCLADLKESGAIEQDADHVWFVYHTDEPDADTSAKDFVIAGKYREGARGRVPMAFVDGRWEEFETRETALAGSGGLV